MKQNGTAVVGINFTGLLTVLFIGLKLAGIINWSWWLVLIFFWLPFAVLGLIALVVGILYLLSKFKRVWNAE